MATGPYGNETIPLLDYITQGHTRGVLEAAELAAQWDTLRGTMDEARFTGVQGRFKQQVHDAGVFKEVILSFYANISGLAGSSPYPPTRR